MKTIFISAEGCCEKRLLDAKKISAYFAENNYKIVNKPKNADIIIFVACAVFNSKVEYSFKKIKNFQKYDSELIVAGCLPDIETEKLSEIFDGETISTKNLEDIDCLFPENKIKFNCVKETNILFQNLNYSRPVGASKKIFREIKSIEKLYIRTRNHVIKNLFSVDWILYPYAIKKLYHIKISGGCLGNCSYCGIKKAIGNIKSKPFNQCIGEFRKGLKEGYENFAIVADDVGAYGLDIGRSFPELLDNMTKIPSKYEMSIYSIDPRWIIKYINELEAILKRQKIKQVIVPIQSGCSRILNLMHRYSDTKEMNEVFLSLKNFSSNLSIRTGIICGFPTETREEFEETLKFILEVNFEGGKIFPFSCKSGTEAEIIEPKVPKKEISRRLKYAKNYLKKAGYHVIDLYLYSGHSFIFYRRR